MNPDFAIQIECLQKVYSKHFEALKSVQLHASKGVVFGLLGPNGAGKSTLIKSLLTLLRPTKVEGWLLGAPIGDRKTLSRVGYLPEHPNFPKHLTGRQVIEYSGGLSGLSAKQIKHHVDHLLQRVKMKQWANLKMGSYSKGMKQRIGIAQALVNDPDLLFLDEPTDGVDPEGRMEIRKIIKELKADGRTVFVNSHLLGEMEQMADEIAILDQGKVLLTGNLEQLVNKQTHYEIRTQGPIPLHLKEQLTQKKWLVAGNCLTLEADNALPLQEGIDAIRQLGLNIESIQNKKQSLEDLFLETVHAAS